MLITIYSLLQELRSFADVSDQSIRKAKSSKINNRTNSTFSRLVQGWKNGEYDEDPIILVDEVEFLLK